MYRPSRPRSTIVRLDTRVSVGPQIPCSVGAYLVVARGVEVRFEISIQSPNLSLRLHVVDHFVGIVAALLDTPLVTFNDLLGSLVAFIVQPVEYPIVEMVTPMQ